MELVASESENVQLCLFRSLQIKCILFTMVVKVFPDKYYFKRNIVGLDRLLFNVKFMQANGEDLSIDNMKLMRNLADVLYAFLGYVAAAYVLLMFFSIVETFTHKLDIHKMTKDDALRILMVLYRRYISDNDPGIEKLRSTLKISGKKLVSLHNVCNTIKKSKNSIRFSAKRLILYL